MRINTGMFVRVVATGFTIALAAPAAASPPDTMWVEDIHLHPPGPAELGFEYDYRSEDAAGPGVHAIALRALVGFDRFPLDFVPSFGLTQFGTQQEQLDHVGVRVRHRLLGDTGAPKVAVMAGYRLIIPQQSEHRIEQGIAVRQMLAGFTLSGEFVATEGLGGPFETAIEVSAGAAIARSFFADYFSVAAETFAIIPLKGGRMTDLSFGGTGDDIAVYIGPSARLNLESLWLGVGFASGLILEPGADAMVRIHIGVQL